MSDLTDAIARTHRVTAVNQSTGTIKCTCGVRTESRASEGMLDVHSRHVAEVIEAQVRAHIAAEIEAAIESMRRNVQSTYSLWPGMEFAVDMLRGDS